MKIAELVGSELARLGVAHAFGVVGSGNFEVTNALRAAGVPFTAARHEGGAATMADAYARTSTRPAVLSVHQGPGLTNAATGIAEAAKSRTPLIVVAAEAPASDPNNNFAMDQEALARSLGAEHVRVTAADQAAGMVERAYRLAAWGRRTVLLNLPIDVLAEDAPAVSKGHDSAQSQLGKALAPAADDVKTLASMLRESERPVFIAGRGARGRREALLALAKQSGALLATSAVAKGLFDGADYDLGIAGGFSTPVAADLIAGADLVVGFGCALNDWTTRRGTLLGAGASIVQVDDTPHALGRHRDLTHGVLGDVGLTAEAVTAELVAGRADDERPPTGYRTAEVANSIIQWGTWALTDTETVSEAGRVDPRVITKALDRLLPRDRVLSVDSGNFMGYPSQYLSVPDEAGFCFTQAFQAVGLGLGTGIGAALASSDRFPVVATGDGGFLMGIADLETAVRIQLPLLVVVYDDAAYGAEVHHFGAGDGATPDLSTVEFPERDLAQLARGFGAEGAVVRSVGDLAIVRGWLDSEPTVPLVLDIKIANDGGAWWLQEAFAGGSGEVSPASEERASARRSAEREEQAAEEAKPAPESATPEAPKDEPVKDDPTTEASAADPAGAKGQGNAKGRRTSN